MQEIKNVTLTEDTLKNILIMAPLLDEVGQNRVFGLVCGLILGSEGVASGKRSVVNQGG